MPKGVPIIRLMKRPQVVRTSISLPPDRMAWIQKAANAEGTSVSDVVRIAIDKLREAELLEAQPA